MEPERWRQVERVLEPALDRPGEERAAWLEQACGGDQGLRREVESLLEHEARAAQFIETPAPAIAAKLLARYPETGTQTQVYPHTAPEMAGRIISHYRILEKLGEGGMGTVYRAVRADDVYEKQVAIKFVRPDGGAGFVLHRFESERRILADLEHPNRARLLDGGTTDDGVPFLVMELVEGQAIDSFCDSRRLSTADRLKLFCNICSAVQYAHQRLVIHRDLKPGNILVTAEGVPKLLDFGIAKILKPEPVAGGIDKTDTLLHLMTPEYASPEQLRGKTISTATDVYSLGVVLYSLLTGHLPYRFSSRSPYEVAQAVCEVEAEPASAAVCRFEDASRIALTPELVSSTREESPEKLRRRLTGDIDSILQKALRKEPEHRYASVEQFVEDIRRHMAGLPVLSRQGTVAYRSAKFVKRHKRSVVAGAMAALTLMAGTVAIAREARIARMERAKADKRFNDVRQLAGSLVFELHDAIQGLPGSTPARELIVRRGLQFLDGLAGESAGDIALERELADAYRKIGDVQGAAGTSNLGQPAAALESYRKALGLRERVAAARGSDPRDKLALASAYANVSNVLALTGNTIEAEINNRSALQIRQALAAAEPANLDFRSGLAMSYSEIAFGLTQKRDLTGALESYRKALPLYKQIADARPGNLEDQRNLSLAHKRAGAILIVQHQLPEARQHYESAMAIDEARCRANPDDPRSRLDLTYSYSDLARILWKSGDFAAALEKYRKVLAIREPLAAADPKNARAQNSLIGTFSRVGALLNETGNSEAAIPPLLRALALEESMITGDQASAEHRISLAGIYEQLGVACESRAGRQRGSVAERLELWREAQDWYGRAVPIYREMKAAGRLVDSDFASMDSASRGLEHSAAAIAEFAATP